MRDGTTAAIVVVGFVFICGLVLILGAMNKEISYNRDIRVLTSKDDRPCTIIPEKPFPERLRQGGTLA
jgi:hypothetical protein